MTGRNVVAVFLVLVLCFPLSAYAADKPMGQPFQSLQQQIDALKGQLAGLPGFTPPTITPAITCTGALSLDISLSIADDREIAYYAVQEQGGNPPINLIIFAEPGASQAEYVLTVEPSSATRTLLFIAADTEGNVGKSVVEIPPDICFGPCAPGTVCP